jgi:LuxR family maltose regulon positive regulatory protein
LLNVFLGNLRLAHDQSQQALQVLHDVGVSGSPIESFAHVSLGRIFIEWGEYEQANHYLTQAVQLGARTGFVTGMLSSATLMLAEVKQARGDEQGAREAVQAAVAHAERHDPPPEVQWLKVYAARVALMQGKTADAAEWLQAAQSQTLINSLFYPNSVRHVTQARLLLAQRKTNEALALLTKLVGEPHDLLTIEALNLLAIGRQAGGDHVHALLTVEQALALAATENRVRAFVDLGAPMSKLLTRFCEAHPEHAFARRVLAQFPSQVDLPETLGARELEVLRLIVAGRSNEEIARELTLALSTVKWYINELYGKLHVKTRSQAIARAHEWRLLQ